MLPALDTTPSAAIAPSLGRATRRKYATRMAARPTDRVGQNARLRVQRDGSSPRASARTAKREQLDDLRSSLALSLGGARPGEMRSAVPKMSNQVVNPGFDSLHENAERAGPASGIEASLQATRGHPRTHLPELSGEVDRLMVGSRRWLMAARVVLERAGKEGRRHASCSVTVVPRRPSPEAPITDAGASTGSA